MLEVNTMAPDFTLQDQNGNTVSLHDFRGSKVVIYFYSKDSTSGCTTQTCRYNDHVEEFEGKGVTVLGISKDTVSSHARFAEKLGLKFSILADPDKTVLQAYDVLKEKTMYGKKVMGTVRSSYVIDENGMIIAARKNVKADLDAEQVLKLV